MRFSTNKKRLETFKSLKIVTQK